jgi:cell division control protein 6
MEDIFQSCESPIFKNKNVLSPHYIPQHLPYREDEIKEIARTLSPALKGEKPKNIFIYGKTGTGKTCTVKFVMRRFNEKREKAKMVYVNCRIYNSRYRILHRILKEFYPELEKAGFGLPFFYEKLLSLFNNGMHLVAVLDEIDMVRDLDDLIYTLTRANDECEQGSISLVGISNKLSFKNELDPRSKSSLYEKELVFPPYTAEQLLRILEERAKIGLKEGVVKTSALQLVALIAAKETGDARYALKLFESAAELAEQSSGIITDKEVEAARRKVEIDLTCEALSTLPENHQLALYAIVRLTKKGGRYAKLLGSDDGLLTSGEVYEEYEKVCHLLQIRPRSARWFKEYLSDLETLGFITLTLSGKGVKGHTTFIKLGVELEHVLQFFKKWEHV